MWEEISTTIPQPEDNDYQKEKENKYKWPLITYYKNLSYQTKSLIFVWIFVFLFSYFTFIGYFTDFAFGETFLGMGDTSSEKTTIFWTVMSINILVILVALSWSISLYLRNRRATQRELMLAKLVSLSFVAGTLFVFALESISLIVFINQALGINLTLNLDLGLGGLGFNSLSVESDIHIFENVMICIWILILLLIILIFLSWNIWTRNEGISELKYNKIRNYSAGFFSASFLFLMLGVFGLGSFGINTATLDAVDYLVINIGNNSYEIIDPNWNFNNEKSMFWGVNNNWPGYLLFASLILVIISIFILTIMEMFFENSMKRMNFIGKEAFYYTVVASIIVVLSFYSLDKFIIRYINDGLVNPSMFNDQMIQLIKFDYHGTPYYWTVFILMPVLYAGSSLIYLKLHKKEKIN